MDTAGRAGTFISGSVIALIPRLGRSRSTCSPAFSDLPGSSQSSGEAPGFRRIGVIGTIHLSSSFGTGEPVPEKEWAASRNI